MTKRLSVAAYGMHTSDQVGLVATPLVAVLVFQASPATVGTLVALQSLPHLLGSLPSGLLADRFRPAPVAIGSAVLSTCGFALVTVAVAYESTKWFATFILLSGMGVVLFVLAALSLIPRVVSIGELAASNARIELPRAIAAVVAPLFVGIMVDVELSGLSFALASTASAIALLTLLSLPRSRPRVGTRMPISRNVAQGIRMVLSHRLLQPIAITAVLWNLAFAVLMVAAVPFMVDHLEKGSEVFGLAMSAFGVGSMIGIWTMRIAASRIQPRFVLLLGPSSSAIAALTVFSLPARTPTLAVMFLFFVLGFGPSMWLVAQNTIRQAVTPEHILGSVNAVIQTAIYGFRPLGAIAGGLAISGTDSRTGLLIVGGLFTCSSLTVVLSQLRQLSSYETAIVEHGEH